MKAGAVIQKEGVNYLVLPGNKVVEIARFENGVPVLRTTVTQKEEGVDAQGNKIVSTSVNIEPFQLEITEIKI